MVPAEGEYSVISGRRSAAQVAVSEAWAGIPFVGEKVGQLGAECCHLVREVADPLHRCVPQAELHEGELEYTEWSGDGRLLYIVGMDGSHQIDLGEDGTTEKFVGIVMDMTDEVAVGAGPGV
jgi:hypothetical protein